MNNIEDEFFTSDGKLTEKGRKGILDGTLIHKYQTIEKLDAFKFSILGVLLGIVGSFIGNILYDFVKSQGKDFVVPIGLIALLIFFILIVILIIIIFGLKRTIKDDEKIEGEIRKSFRNNIKNPNTLI